MKKQFGFELEVTPRLLVLVAIFILPLYLSACSSSYEKGSALLPGDEMMEGPGIFSGKKGGFYLVGGKDKVTTTESVSNMSASETSKLIDDRIEKLKRDQIELEALKEDLNKKLQK